MRDDIARARLSHVPADIGAALLSRRAELPAGAIAVVDRFFAALTRAGAHPSAPPRAVFDEACGSEATLALLLRTLERHAPEVGLAAGRELRREHYRRRPGGSAHETDRRRRSPVAPRDWPADWTALLPGLMAAPIRASSRDQHVAAANRCAALLPALRCPPRLGWLLGWELSQHLAGRGVTARSSAVYLGGLVGLGRHGGLEKDALNGLRAIQAHLIRQGRRLPKRKQGRLDELHDRGGYAAVIRAIVDLLDQARSGADWRAEVAMARATAAVLALCVNMPARAGDVARWRLGEHLVREPWGEWRLGWHQEKTGHFQDAGVLWPEVGLVLDEHVLGGRPDRQVHRRYDELRGMNWLSLGPEPYTSRWPSARVRAAIGVPLHDLRTLAADYLRLHDPAAAPGVVAALLGHRSPEAGEAYRALCTDTAAQRDWQAVRQGM